MRDELLTVITNWLNEKLMDSDQLKKIKTAIENDELIIYGCVEFILNNTAGQKRIIREENRISLKNITEKELKDKLDALVERIKI